MNNSGLNAKAPQGTSTGPVPSIDGGTLETEIIPVISLWMPWANWVAMGWKPIETRRHNRFKSLLGKRIGIHASVKWDRDWRKCAEPYLTMRQIERTMGFLRIGGAIICTAIVADYGKLDAGYSRGALIDCGSVERYGLFLQDVQSIEAIPCKGMQGIWYHPVPKSNGELPLRP